VEDIVAVEVQLESGARRYFLTWGRIQDAVDPAPLARLVLSHAHRFGPLDGVPKSSRVLWSLHPALQAPEFFECFFDMCQIHIPTGDEYEAWRKSMDAAMRRGEQIRYLSYFKVPEQPDEPDAVLEESERVAQVEGGGYPDRL
jgi:hypothetical protein